MNGRPLVFVAVVMGIVAAVSSLLDPTEAELSPATQPSEEPLPPVTEQDGLTVITDSAFASEYAAEGRSAKEDLKAVAELLDSAVILVKDIDRFPLADNADFTAFLQGKNPHRVAWIAPGHPAVGGQGELLDRWGTALFFHRESSRRTTLRSAGPDRKMWTDDDVVWPEDLS